MAQKNLSVKKKAKKSSGALRKKIGVSRHGNHGQLKKDELRTAAGAKFITIIEQDLASKLPSDQRQKLTVLKNTGTNRVDPKINKHKKKPLTRGRSRKQRKAKGTI